MKEWNDREEFNLQKQRGKVKRISIIFLFILITFSIYLFVSVLVGMDFIGSVARELCGITNC